MLYYIITHLTAPTVDQKALRLIFLTGKTEKKQTKKQRKKKKYKNCENLLSFFFVVLHLVWTHKQTLKSFSLTSTKMWAGGEGRVGLSGKGWVSLRETMQWSVWTQAYMSTLGFSSSFFPLSLNKTKTKKIPKKMSKNRWNGIPTNIPQTCRAIVKLYS